ncbi:MAG: diacylglycerol/lipid kinase family protein [Candidatus Aminicenantales bacterium]
MNGGPLPENGVRCVVNPDAARKKWLRRKKLHQFLKENLPGQVIDVLADKETTIRLVRDLCRDCETIVAVGGDGTVADILQGIREAGRQKDVRLGIIPIGSGNAFRRSLAIPKKPRKSIDILYQGKEKIIDLMDVEGKLAGFASIGATARVTQEKLVGSVQGFWGHVLAGIILFKLSPWELEVELENGLDEQGNPFQQRCFHLKALDCVVAKSNYFGYGWKIAPQASLEDGLLDITFFEMGGLKYVLLLPLIFFGLYQRRLRHFKAKKLILKGKDLPIQYHGEFLGTRDRVEIRVLPRAIRVICPR